MAPIAEDLRLIGRLLDRHVHIHRDRAISALAMACQTEESQPRDDEMGHI